MARHRGLFLALGFCALIGLTARESRAESIIMTISWTGGSITVDTAVSSQFLGAGSSDTNLIVNVGAVNSFLNSNGSAINFTGTLGAGSNFPGGNPNPLVANLTAGGTAVLNGTGTATSITISVSEAGFTTPSGLPGTLSSTQTAIIAPGVVPITTGGMNQSSTSSYNTTLTPTLATDVGTFQTNSVKLTSPIASSYTLDNTTTIDLTGSPKASGTTDQFQTLTTLTAVPEPTSIIMMLTGVPLPLVVLGLLRRRRAAA
jgi:hypothetical protein